MTFSIVIPVFNGEKYLDQAILSALRQTRFANEVIVHDDNSTDSTKQICEKYISRVKYHYNPDGPSGFVNGWNKSITLASSEFVSILHQDDILYPEFLEEAEEALVRHPEIKHLFSLCDYIDSTGETLVSYYKELYKNGNLDKIRIYQGIDYVKAYQKNYGKAIHIHRCPGVITHHSVFKSGFWYNPDAGHIADDDFFSE